ncbi:Nose resistant to fluoxetine protein [Dirofilaria immitis]
MAMGCYHHTTFPVLCFILILAINGCETVIVRIPEYTIQNVHADQEEIHNDFLLLETLLFDFLNALRPIEMIQMNQSIDESTKIVEKLTNIIKQPHISTLIETKQFQNFIKSKITDEINECIKDLAKLIDSAVNALLITSYCRLSGQNQTHIKQCLDMHLTFDEYLSQILDAWGRPSSGIYSSGPFFWLGAYDQCQDISKMMTKNQSVQYCRANIRIDAYGMEKRQISVFYGMCLPVHCNSHIVHDILSILSFSLKKTFGILISNSTTVECVKQKGSFFNEFTILQWTILIILGLLVLLVVSGTMIDTYRRRHQKYSINNEESSKSCGHISIRLTKNIPSQASSICTPYVQGDEHSFIYSDAPSQALTYKSAPTLRRTLKKSSSIITIIHAFSIRSTYHYLTRPCNHHLDSLHAIRVLSAFWVVVGHAHLFSLEYVGNIRQLWNLLKANEQFSQIIFNSSLSVDSFLLLSGTVLAYKVHLHLIRQKRRKNGRSILSPCGWLMLWLHRFIRLIPAYFITLLIIHFIFQDLGDGPMWSQQNGIFGARCSKNDIWRQLLFLSNFYPNECMPWMWYLALDTQFYMIAPIVLLLLHTVPTIAGVLVVVATVLSIIYRVIVIVLFRFPTTFISALLENGELTTQLMEKMFRYLYAAPQARIGPFLIGIILGWLLSRKSKQTLSTAQIDVTRLISFAMLTFSLFGANYANDFSIFSVFYAATFRVFWAFGLALFIWLCERGHMQIIYSCLAWNKWTFFSRLSYGFYLSHEPILLYFIWTRRSAIMPLSSYHFIIYAIEISLLSLLPASLIAFMIEIPPLIIERKIFKTIRARITTNEANDETKKNDAMHKSNLQFFHHQQQKNDQIIELAPMISPINRTKRWIEENHEDLPIASIRPRNATNTQIRHHRTATFSTDIFYEGNKKSDGSVKSDAISTCKNFSNERRQLQNFVDNTDNVAHKNDIITKKQYANAPEIDGLQKKKQKVLINQNYDKQVSVTENIGFSWVEDAEKNHNAEQNIHSQSSYNKQRNMTQYTDPNQQQQQQQHFDINSFAKQTSLSNKSSNSTNTGETIIHVINENAKNSIESYS